MEFKEVNLVQKWGINLNFVQMIGLKRSYPFSVDDVPVPSFDCRFPPAYISHIPTTDEPASFNNDGTFPLEQANPVVR